MAKHNIELEDVDILLIYRALEHAYNSYLRLSEFKEANEVSMVKIKIERQMKSNYKASNLSTESGVCI